MINAEYFSYILFHVALFMLKALWKFKLVIKNKAATETITDFHSSGAEVHYRSSRPMAKCRFKNFLAIKKINETPLG